MNFQHHFYFISYLTYNSVHIYSILTVLRVGGNGEKGNKRELTYNRILNSVKGGAEKKRENERELTNKISLQCEVSKMSIC